MSILGANELARSRADYEATLSETCTITQPSGAVTTEGGLSSGSSIVATGVACRVATAGPPTAADIAAGVRAQEGVIVSLPATQTVPTSGRITVGAVAYEVIKPLTDSLGIARRVLCKVV
jgi:hypothetical protein